MQDVDAARVEVLRSGLSAKAAGVSAWADGLVSTLPEGTVEAAAATLSNAFPKLGGVIDSVMAEKKGDGDRDEEPFERPTRSAKMAGAEMTEAPEPGPDSDETNDEL